VISNLFELTNDNVGRCVLATIGLWVTLVGGLMWFEAPWGNACIEGMLITMLVVCFASWLRGTCVFETSLTGQVIVVQYNETKGEEKPTVLAFTLECRSEDRVASGEFCPQKASFESSPRDEGLIIDVASSQISWDKGGIRHTLLTVVMSPLPQYLPKKGDAVTLREGIIFAYRLGCFRFVLLITERDGVSIGYRAKITRGVMRVIRRTHELLRFERGTEALNFDHKDR